MSTDDPEKLLNNWLGELDSLILVSQKNFFYTNNFI